MRDATEKYIKNLERENDKRCPHSKVYNGLRYCNVSNTDCLFTRGDGLRKYLITSVMNVEGIVFGCDGLLEEK